MHVKIKVFLMLLVMLMPSMALAQDSQKNFDYFFNLLADCPTLEKMVEECRHYGMQEEYSDNSFKVYLAPNGNLFKFRMDSISEKKRVPVIEMTARTPKNELERILINLGYKKEGNKYIKGTNHTPSIRSCVIKEDKKSKESKLCLTIKYN